MRVDLHIHTTYSDGLLTPKQVVKKACGLGLSAISITDHDTINGILPAMDQARECPELEVIPGIEFSTELNNEEVHILGYNHYYL